MKKIVLIYLVFGFFSCEKEKEVTPANIYGTWQHYFSWDGIYHGMRFHNNGSFEYLEKSGRDDWHRQERYKNYHSLTYELNGNDVSIFGHDSFFSTPSHIEGFRIKSLTNSKLVQEDDFEWEREN